jgi:hypothetical protein
MSKRHDLDELLTEWDEVLEEYELGCVKRRATEVRWAAEDVAAKAERR